MTKQTGWSGFADNVVLVACLSTPQHLSQCNQDGHHVATSLKLIFYSVYVLQQESTPRGGLGGSPISNNILTLQIQSAISRKWTDILKKNTYNSPLLEIKNKIYVNKSQLEIEKVKCTYFYWYLITNIQYTPRAISAWENVYTNFKGKDNNFWKIIFKMTFLRNRQTLYKQISIK